jgi:flagellar motor protein MotB
MSTAVLSFTLAVAAPAYATQEQHDQQEEQKAKPAEQGEKKAQPEKPAKQAQKPAAQGQKPSAQQEKKAQPEEKNTRQPVKNTKPAQKSAQQQHAQPAPSKQQHAANRIPDDRFKANFGQQHRFRVSQADYSQNRRFQYGGYSFGFVDPWPSNWLYTQDVYVVEINGIYYLCNPMYPGVNIALSVTL